MNSHSSVLIACIVLLVSAVHCGGEPEADHEKALAILSKAVGFLWEKQGADGGWHSETHGILKGGQAWTPFVLLALLDASETHGRGTSADVERGMTFIRNHISPKGVLGASDPDVLEYPNYASAYALRLIHRIGRKEDSSIVRQVQSYLIAEQFVEQRDFSREDLVYGSWGFGETYLPERTSGFVDISHTRRVLQALRETGLSDHPLYEKSTVFIRLLQKHPTESRIQPGFERGRVEYDGGFYFSPVVVARNKGGLVEDTAGYSSSYRSYATATCDGLLGLVYAGVPPDDERVLAALQWLDEHPMMSRPEGIPEDHPDKWHRVMFFYHLLVRSEVNSLFRIGGSWREEMIDLLAKEQRPDGSFSNPYGELNKEDDPVLATAMAVYTLTNVVRNQEVGRRKQEGGS